MTGSAAPGAAAAGAARPIEARLAAAGLPPLTRLVWLEIDTEALAANLRALRTLAPPGARVAAVVKADGYGHGLEVAARSFLAGGADMLCVATFDEALALRGAGIEAPLLILYGVPPDAARAAGAAGIELVAAEGGATKALLAALGRGPAPARRLRLHVEVETGLGRAGFPPAAVPDAVRRLLAGGRVELAGLWTHLASSHDPAATRAQLAAFRAAADGLRAAGLPLPARHVAATGGLLGGWAGETELVRPGLCGYGLLPADFPLAPAARPVAAGLRPAMTLKARPLRVEEVAAGQPVGYGGLWRAARPSRVATLPVGYGDGWARAYGGGGDGRAAQALVRGRRVPLVGSVAMDAVAADVTDIPGPPVSPADEFVLLGAQGGELIAAAELARLRTTIAWEVVTGMAARVARVYHARPGLSGLRTLGGESWPAPRSL